jgi:hypothetical protein
MFQERLGMGSHEINPGVLACDRLGENLLASAITMESSREKEHAQKIDDDAKDFMNLLRSQSWIRTGNGSSN